MILFPAIDIFEGKVVRLARGDYTQKTVYAEHPEEIAAKWQKEGAAWIHVVDLEGARSGQPACLDALRKIRETVPCKIQFGGGLRSLKAAETVLAYGADRIVLGSKSLDKHFVQEAVARFGDRVAIGLDTRDGKVRTDGWLKDSGQDLAGVVQMLEDVPVGTWIITDIQKDGMLAGPNLEMLGNFLKLTSAKVVLSGGIASLEDVEKAASIRERHFEGVIIGKALYEGKFRFEEAIQKARKGGV